jgi:Leucine-rich repeat (LRR) protein
LPLFTDMVPLLHLFSLSISVTMVLIRLHLGGNELTTLPVGICELHQLKKFYCKTNQLTSLPNQFGARLTSLESIDLSVNRLSDLPERFADLSQLQTLFLSRNEFSVLPSPLIQLSSLTHLDLQGNKVSIHVSCLSKKK